MDRNPFKTQRQSLHKSKAQLARELGVSTQIVWQWEHDRAVPRTSRVESLMAAYEIDVGTLRDWLGQQAMRVQAHRLDQGAT